MEKNLKIGLFISLSYLQLVCACFIILLAGSILLTQDTEEKNTSVEGVTLEADENDLKKKTDRKSQVKK
ncbi:MAG: hypothetical protein K2X86_08450 [Cytophagaceae bacterium]|nr:hypothetical protein [Cytophagaceae bacterium]